MAASNIMSAPPMSSPVPVSPVFYTVEVSPWFLDSSGPLPVYSTSPARVFVHSNYMCGVSSLPGSFSFTVVDTSFSNSPRPSLAYGYLHYYFCLGSTCMLAHTILTALQLPSSPFCQHLRACLSCLRFEIVTPPPPCPLLGRQPS